MWERDRFMSPDGGNGGRYLAGLSTLSLRSFTSTDDVVQAILELIVDYLGLRTSFITRINQEQNQNTVTAAYNRAGGSDVPSPIDLTLHQTF